MDKVDQINWPDNSAPEAEVELAARVLAAPHRYSVAALRWAEGIRDRDLVDTGGADLALCEG